VAVLAGVGVGMGYGIALRAWMRLVSENPEFSWSGTLFIVGAFTIAGAFAGLVVGARRRQWRALLVLIRIVAVVLSLSCFGGAGVVMLPTIVPGALALARTDWPQWVRRILAVVSGLSVLIVFTDADRLGLVRAVVAIVTYLALVLVEIRIFSEAYQPTVTRLPALCKVLAGVAAGAAVLGVAAMTVGVMTSGG
jgi:hypothetical protein